jgi:hypothetical protein
MKSSVGGGDTEPCNAKRTICIVAIVLETVFYNSCLIITV